MDNRPLFAAPETWTSKRARVNDIWGSGNVLFAQQHVKLDAVLDADADTPIDVTIDERLNEMMEVFSWGAVDFAGNTFNDLELEYTRSGLDGNPATQAQFGLWVEVFKFCSYDNDGDAVVMYAAPKPMN